MADKTHCSQPVRLTLFSLISQAKQKHLNGPTWGIITKAKKMVSLIYLKKNTKIKQTHVAETSYESYITVLYIRVKFDLNCYFKTRCMHFIYTCRYVYFHVKFCLVYNIFRDVLISGLHSDIFLSQEEMSVSMKVEPFPSERRWINLSRHPLSLIEWYIYAAPERGEMGTFQLRGAQK